MYCFLDEDEIYKVLLVFCFDLGLVLLWGDLYVNVLVKGLCYKFGEKLNEIISSVCLLFIDMYFFY